MKTFVVFVTLLYVSQHASAVETYEGVESVLLPCDFSTFDLNEASVVWSRSYLRPSTVHQRQPDGDELKDQNQDYRGRTSMRTDALRTGDLSLTLRRPTTRDSGIYTCIVRERGQEEKQSQVPLQVKERPVDWSFILIGVCCLLLSLAAAVYTVILYTITKEISTGFLPVEIKVVQVLQVLLVLLILLFACEVGLCIFFLHKGTENKNEPPPDWITGLMGLLSLLFLLFLLLPLLLLTVLGYRVTDKALIEKIFYLFGFSSGRHPDWVKVLQVLQVLLVLLVLLAAVAVVPCCVILHKGIKNTQVSWHGDTVEVYDRWSVLLPCEDSPLPIDPTVMWRRHDLRPPTVHQRHQLGDDLRDQNEVYRSRTSMKTESLRTGDLSLTLRNLHLSDSGNYTCSISASGNERTLRNIELKVKEKYSTNVEGFVLCGFLVLLVLLVVPLGVAWCLKFHKRLILRRVQEVEVEKGAESVQLPFKTTADLSEDVRVEWTNRHNKKVHEFGKGSQRGAWFSRGQTEMNEDLLRTGDLSLTLKHPRVKDTGGYRCRVYDKDGDILRETAVFLSVKGTW